MTDTSENPSEHENTAPRQALAFQEELAQLLFAQATSTMLVGVLTFCIAAVLLYSEVDTRYLALWLALGIGSHAIRVPLFVKMRRNPNAPLPINIYTLFVGLSGAIWGTATILFWSPSLTIVNQIVLILFPMALSIAAVTSYCASPRVYMAFVFPAQLPFIVLTLFSGDTTIMTLAAPALLFIGGQMVLFNRFHKQITTSLWLRRQNQVLIDDLSQQNDELAKARDAAEVSSKAKGEFLTRVSHEFRTPINGILGPLQLLQSSSQDAQQAHLLGTIQESGNRLLRMVDDVVEVSTLEASEPKTRQIDYSLEKLIEQLVSRWKSIANKKGLSLDWSIDASVPAALLGDDKGVSRLLEHLFSNAIEFTEEGGLTLHATLDTFETAEPRLRLTVSDTGIGIASDQLGAIFDDFSQGQDSMTRQSSGTGIGLAIVRRLARAMGGTVEAVSDQGIGSTFLVLLPMTVGSVHKLRKITRIDAPAVAPEQAKVLTPAQAQQLPQEKTHSKPQAATRLSPEAKGNVTRLHGKGNASNARAASVESKSKACTVTPGLRALVAEDNRVNQMVIEAMLNGLGCDVLVVDNGKSSTLFSWTVRCQSWMDSRQLQRFGQRVIRCQ